MKKLITVLAMTLSLGLIMAQPANANPASSAEPTYTNSTTPVSPEDVAGVTPELFEQGMEEIDASSIPRTTKTIGTEQHTTYDLPDGQSFTVARPLTIESPSGQFSPYLSAGKDVSGVYVYLNQFDQDAIISGGAFAIGAAICAIPAIGWAACTGVGAALTAAALYLSHNGKCSNNRQLKAYIFIPERNRCV